MKLNPFMAIVAFVAGVFVTSAQTRAMSEGEKPYSPTRLEWLAVNMEAQMRIDLSDRDGFSLDFAAPPGQNTILIYVRYLPRVEREIMNARIETAKQVIAIAAKARGWSWLKVQEDVKMQNLPPQK
jgi:hypothetical protein